MALSVSRSGNELVEFLPPNGPLDPAIPVTFTQVVTRYQHASVLVYVTERDQWETPGGGIEPGEHVDDCAVRELWEETGQVAAAIHHVGWFRIHFARDGRQEYGALYVAELAELRPFAGNDEIGRIMLWNGTDHVDRLGDWSKAFMAYCG